MKAGAKPDPYKRVRLASMTVHYVSKRSGRRKRTLCGKLIPLGQPLFNDFDDWELDGEVDCGACLTAILHVPRYKRGWRPTWTRKKRAIPDISSPSPRQTVRQVSPLERFRRRIVRPSSS